VVSRPLTLPVPRRMSTVSLSCNRH
jgi:hypothetical protein